jgi:hypothetical protein
MDQMFRRGFTAAEKAEIRFGRCYSNSGHWYEREIELSLLIGSKYFGA